MHRWVEHTAEVELEVTAASEEGVFAEALEALADLIAGDTDGDSGAEPVRRRLELEAADRAALLADWLGELAYLAEVEGLVACRVDELALDGARLRATVATRPGAGRPYVKAATYHGLVLERHAGGWRARVVLDV
jgi:SHS2 domain-containing protein